MALRVVESQVLHIPPTGGIGPVEFRILLRGLAEELLPAATTLQLIGMLHRMATLMPQDLDAFFPGAAFDLQHLAAFEPEQARMSQIEGNGNTRNAIWREPIVGEPEVWAK